MRIGTTVAPGAERFTVVILSSRGNDGAFYSRPRILRSMERPTWIAAIVSAVVGVTAIGASLPRLYAQPPVAKAMALTFDDLPFVAFGSTDYLGDAQRATDSILRVLKAHRAPAVAFVNEGKLHAADQTDARIAVLKRWVDAGVILGNHT